MGCDSPRGDQPGFGTEQGFLERWKVKSTGASAPWKECEPITFPGDMSGNIDYIPFKPRAPVCLLADHGRAE